MGTFEDEEWQEDNEIDWDEGIDLKGTEWKKVQTKLRFELSSKPETMQQL